MVIKSRDKAVVDRAQRQYWWGLTPRQRLEVAARLQARVRRLHAANPANPPLSYGQRIHKSATPVPRGQR